MVCSLVNQKDFALLSAELNALLKINNMSEFHAVGSLS